MEEPGERENKAEREKESPKSRRRAIPTCYIKERRQCALKIIIINRWMDGYGRTDSWCAVVGLRRCCRCSVKCFFKINTVKLPSSGAVPACVVPSIFVISLFVRCSPLYMSPFLFARQALRNLGHLRNAPANFYLRSSTEHSLSCAFWPPKQKANTHRN